MLSEFSRMSDIIAPVRDTCNQWRVRRRCARRVNRAQGPPRRINDKGVRPSAHRLENFLGTVDFNQQLHLARERFPLELAGLEDVASDEERGGVAEPARRKLRM